MDDTPDLSFEVKVHSFLPIFQLGVSQLKFQGIMKEAKVLREHVLNWIGVQNLTNMDTCGIEHMPQDVDNIH